MEPRRAIGPGSGALKYDILTALSVASLSGSPTFQTSVLRLIALVTARYNWKADEVTVGQRDMAKMWSVNERTVKREIKRLTDSGLLVCKRKGVRGRVGAYRIDLDRIANLTEECWALVGPDFVERMGGMRSTPTVKVVSLKDYRDNGETVKGSVMGRSPWSRVMGRLARDNAPMFESWFSRLSFVGYGSGVITICAPGAFVQRYIETHLLSAFLVACEQEFGPIDRVVFSE